MIYAERVMLLAQERYNEIKIQRGQMPKDLPSAQIVALCEALCEAFNDELERVKTDVQELYNARNT